MTARTRPSARCRALLLELSRYLDGDLTPARRRTVERHIKACGVLWGRGRTLGEHDGRLPRGREEAAAPRRDVAGGETDQGAG